MSKLHIRLRQYRVIPVAVTVFLMWYCLYLTNWMLDNIKELSEWQLIPFTAIIPSLVAGLFKTSQIALQKHEKDEET